MDQLEYVSRIEKCKGNYAPGTLGAATIQSKPPEERELYIQQKCKEQVTAQMQAEEKAKQQKTSEEENKNKLPTSKDPTLAKKQADAEIQKKKGEAENKVQQEKEKKVEELKSKLASILPLAAAAGVSLLPKFPKLPILDPKVLATLQFLKAQKDAIKAKQEQSTQNLKKAKDTFTFPMQPVEKPEPTPTISATVAPSPSVSPTPPPLPTRTPTPTPTPTPTIPPGISAEDWGRFGRQADREISGDERAVRFALQRRQVRREEIIKIQEERVARGKRFVDFQSERWGKAPDDLSIKASYDNALKVYFKQRAYLEKVRNDSNILDLTE